MSGVLPVVYLLTHSSPLQALVDEADVYPGALPLKFALPAINVEQVDGVPRNTISMLEPNRVWTDRVQATAHVGGNQASTPGLGLPGLAAILNAVVAACPNQHGTVNGVYVLSILPDTRGPYMYATDTGHIAQSQDFMVTWRT